MSWVRCVKSVKEEELSQQVQASTTLGFESGLMVENFLTTVVVTECKLSWGILVALGFQL